MSNVTLNRLSGLALILSFALSLAGGLLHPVVEGEAHSLTSLSQPVFPIAHFLVFLGGACLLFGLPALYARIAPTTGILGLTGFVMYFFANATLVMFFTGYETFVAPVLAADPATSDLVAPGGAIPGSTPLAVLEGVGGPVYMLGLLLLGVAVARSRVLPRWSGILMALAPILLLLPVPEASILTGLLIELPRGLAVASIGYALFTGEREELSTASLPTGTKPVRQDAPTA